MIVFNTQSIVLRNPSLLADKYISVKEAVAVTGYNAQYLRRLLRSGNIEGLKIGQIWLIDWNSLCGHMIQANSKLDHRYGPKISKVRGKEEYTSTTVNTPCLQTYTGQEESHECTNS